jgi:DNA repair exonuclease SbcCD ATPase subunit
VARGITEQDVHSAADELVAAGERPTIERIRAHLGTGSPNTVTRWLETWWQELGNRLQAQQRRLAVPGAPEAVAALAGEWWTLALEHARAAAHESNASDRVALQTDQEALRKEREEFAAEAAALREQMKAAVHAERLASIQAAELQRLTNQLEGHVEEMARQRDAALARASEANAARQAIDVRVQELQDAARSERASLAQHVQAIEDRAHAEIDRARQEAKELQSRLTAITKEHAAATKVLEEIAEQAKSKAADAVRDADAQRARADALEAQLAKLQDLPAALEAVWRRSEVHKPARKASAKKARSAHLSTK